MPPLGANVRLLSIISSVLGKLAWLLMANETMADEVGLVFTTFKDKLAYWPVPVICPIFTQLFVDDNALSTKAF